MGGMTVPNIEMWPIARLKAYERNPRKNDKAVDQMVMSIKEYGFVIPVLARSATGLVIDGHLRLKGAIKLGLAEVPVIPCDGWTEAQVKAFRLLANRSATWADWDMDLLKIELGELKGIGL
jgi:ParB-like chromosome segregation protein Spo0J